MSTTTVLSYTPSFIVILFGALALGLIFLLMRTLSQLKTLCAENERVLALLIEKQNADRMPEESQESGKSQIPFFEDSDCEFDCETKKSTRGSSGYNTESDKEMEQLIDTIGRAPSGPVSMDQTYLTFSCVYTGLYVKAIVDSMHTLIHVVTWQQNENSEWDWMPTTCNSCIELIRRTLADGNCQVPFAMDQYDDKEDIKRQLAEYEAMNETMIIGTDEEEEINRTMEVADEMMYSADFEMSSDADSEDFEATDYEGVDSDNLESEVEDFAPMSSDFDSEESEKEDEEEEEDVIEKPIPVLFDMDAFDFSQHDFEYDEEILEDDTIIYGQY